MTRATPRVRARSGSVALVAALVVALLAPTAYLFLHSWNEDSDRKETTRLELDGVTYLRALNQLTLALSSAQISALGAQQVDAAEVANAVEQVNGVNDRLGDDLGASDRWNGLRQQIDQLNANQATDARVLIPKFTAVNELLLALYAKVADRSGLGNDPDADAFHLQDAAATALPAAVVAGTQLAALTVAAGRPPTQLPPNVTAEQMRQFGLIQLGATQARLETATAGLVENLRAAVDNTESRTLGGNLLGQLDAFNLASEDVAALTGINGSSEVSDPSIIPSTANRLRAAAAALSATVLTEVDALLQGRLDELDDERTMLLGAAIAATLLAIAAVTVLVLAARQGRTAFGPDSGSAGLTYPNGRPPTPDDRRWGPDPVVAPYDDLQGASRWERSGAAR